MKNKIYDHKRATTRFSNNAAKRLIPLGMYEFWGAELSNSGGRDAYRLGVDSQSVKLPDGTVLKVFTIQP
jgi:hypothetical protein